jgi:hypothetical protein
VAANGAGKQIARLNKSEKRNDDRRLHAMMHRLPQKISGRTQRKGL